MDPLSVTASIIAVLQATNAIISVCYDYSTSVKGSSTELSRVTEEVKSLRNVLEAVAQLAQKAESADPTAGSQLPTLKSFCEPDVGQLAVCLVELNALKDKLAPPDWSGQEGSKRRRLVQALGWPLKEGETKKTLENIERFKATLNLALTVDQAKLTQTIRDTTLQTQRDLTELNRSFTSMTIDDQRENIHRWLSAPDPSLNQNQALKRRHSKTGTWFIECERFINWKANPDSLLWLHGIPGCGKTILTSTIVEDVIQHCHLSHNNSLVVAYFYFDFNDSEKQKHEKMIRSLITQLSRQSVGTPEALESLCSSHQGSRQPTADALLETLRHIVQEFDESFIILDALDECEERQELLEDIEEIAGWNTGKLHLLATSRKEKDIEESLGPLVDERDVICIQSALVNDDIRAYIHGRLQTDRKLKRWKNKPEVQEEVERTLMEKADGMFRWAACQLDVLGNCLNLPALRKALASLPKTLDDTYAQILCRIDEEYIEYALKILHLLTYSARPLQVDELAEAITVDINDDPRFDPERRFPEPRDILAICPSLVTATIVEVADEYGDPGNTVPEEVRLAHFSVKEYLVSERIKVGPANRYGIQEVPANASIAEICLAYLLQFDDPKSLTSQIFEEFPFASYASMYWTTHAQVAGKDSSTVRQLAMGLFTHDMNVYTSWLLLYNPDDPLAYKSRRTAQLSGLQLDQVPSQLYLASIAGLVELTRLLIERRVEVGVEIDVQGGNYGSALQAASTVGHDQIVQLLLEKGADVNVQEGFHGTALQLASVWGHDKVVQLLLEKGADVNVQGGSYYTALHAASVMGHVQIVQLLLEKGADVNLQGGRYGTALHGASYIGHDQIVQLLLEKGADVNVKVGDYGTALQAASFWGNHRNVQQLLERGADINAQGGEYGAALQGASARGHHQIVQLLLEKGADVNIQGGRYYDTALQAASAKGRDQIAQLLLENGADANLQGGDYGTALQAASAMGHDQIVQLLLENGAKANVQEEQYGTTNEAMSVNCQDEILQPPELPIFIQSFE